jgi:predicted nucleotidyltransferase
MPDRAQSGNSIDLQHRLTRFQNERDQLVAQAKQHLTEDMRVAAAWLFGSLGRGDADELSDIDLFTVIEDEHHPALIGDRYAYMAQLAEPLLILEAPQNWPPGGVYNMALYPGVDGPHQVDWYWVRRSVAAIPAETRLFFDRVNLPRLASPTRFDYAPVPPRPAEEIATQDVNMFWVMLLIAAKYVVRFPATPVVKPPLDSLWRAADFAGVQRSELPVAAPPYQGPVEQIRFLRELAGLMKQVMPQVVARGGRPPDRITPYALHYLDLIEEIVRMRCRHEISGGAST